MCVSMGTQHRVGREFGTHLSTLGGADYPQEGAQERGADSIQNMLRP